MSVDIVEACGFLQKCSGMPAGIEAAVHATRCFYKDPTTEGILLVDAKNAFKCLNCQAALHSVRHLCPALATVLQNYYQSVAHLFVSGEAELSSAEGTTQGDPLSMVFVDTSICWLVEPSLGGLFTKPISNAIGVRVNRNV